MVSEAWIRLELAGRPRKAPRRHRIIRPVTKNTAGSLAAFLGLLIFVAAMSPERSGALALAPEDLDVRATSAAILDWRAPFEAFEEFNDIATKKPAHRYARGQRARMLVELGQPEDAPTDMSAAIAKGGKKTTLKAQLFLRQNNFPEIPLGGRVSPELRTVLLSCFALNACFQGVMRAI
jgi:hypothetical protein